MQNKFEAYLRANGAASTAHSGKSLWSHLSGVQHILQAAGCAPYLCTAGLFHSIYGTQSFKKVIINASQRSEVQALIGQQAEHLVWAFSHLARPALFEASLQTNDFGWLDAITTPDTQWQFWQDLAQLECANLLEQRCLHQFPRLARYAQQVRMLDREGFLV